MSSDAAHPNPDVARRLAQIYKLHRTDIDLRLGTSPYIALLGRLGDPHAKIAPAVHVAGTNGKGSVLAFLRAMLEADGKTVHLYTSPHLIVFNERIILAGQQITDAQLIDLYDRVEAANHGASVTFFEFTTAMAFLAFAEHKADYVLLETGMGGRLDCTNVIDEPIATAITKISFDHTEFLGHTLEAIAAEKAGIMKTGVPCVIGAQMDADIVMPVFQKRAREIGAPIINAVMPDGYPAPSLIGAHQIENAAVAMMLARILKISDPAKRTGLTSAHWPARMQRVSEDPEIWFDAAHNDSGALALAEQLRTWKQEDPARAIHLIVGLAADKDADAFFAALAGCYDRLTLVDLPQARRPQTAAQLAAKTGMKAVDIKPNLKQAIVKSDKSLKNVVAGSLYLYQELAKVNKNERIF